MSRIVVKQSSADRIRRVVETVEAQNHGTRRGLQAPDFGPIEVHVVKATGAPAQSGLYPARRYDWDPVTDAKTEAETCWVRRIDGGTVASADYQFGKLIGEASNGESVYGLAAGGTSAPATTFNGCLITKTATQTIQPYGGQAVTFGPLEGTQKSADPFNYFTQANSITRMVMPASGVYRFTATVQFGAGIGTRRLNFYDVGTAQPFGTQSVLMESNPASFNPPMACTATADRIFNALAPVELWIWSQSTQSPVTISVVDTTITAHSAAWAVQKVG